MLLRAQRQVAAILAATMAVQAICVPAANAGNLFQSVFHMRKPEAPSDPAMETLVEEIDWLEKHIDNYGSIVAKQPDIWGQARLTKHRQEYEQILSQKLDDFDLILNGSLTRSDQSYLASALALSAAVSGGRRAFTRRAPEGTDTLQPQPVDLSVVNTLLPSITPGVVQYKKDDDGNVVPDVDKSQINNQTNIFRSPPGSRAPGFSNQFAHGAKIGLEPTIELDQLSRYLDHLKELRRINEGDDTADSPGYSLNLVRIPISILPGRATRKGYGAEITVTCTPKLSASLLPITFRNLVTNDVVDQLALPITRLADTKAFVTTPEEKERETAIKEAERTIAAKEALIKSLEAQAADQFREMQNLAGPRAETLQGLNFQQSITELRKSADIAVPSNLPKDQADALETYSAKLDESIKLIENERNLLELAEHEIQPQQTLKAAAVTKLSQQVAIATGPSARSRQAKNSVPPSQVLEVFGYAELKGITEWFYKGYQGPNVRWSDDSPQGRVQFLDVQRFLQAEIDAAYELLSRPEFESVWQEFVIEQKLVERLRSASDVDCVRVAFLEELKNIRVQQGLYCAKGADGSARIQSPNPSQDVSTEPKLGDKCVDALAWAIIVEAALLNDQLVRDMTAVSEAKGCGCMPEADLQYYLPHPSPEACESFNQYVLCRWPIHVFALDPVTQDQNIGDTYSRAQELQLALSLSFVSGRMNANSLTRYARRLETEMQTVALNRTVVGFSHGDDTFGWRFFPRFQSPPFKGTVANFGETLAGPHPDGDLKQRQIEPGMRECVAVVIMPSFVPYVTFDTRSNWFRLNHHHGWLPTRHHVENSMVDALKLSRSVRSMELTALKARCPQLYRNGELERIMRRVHQLDKELPLQTMLSQVPVENTLGGFEMFSHGITDLAPELYGWYGGPGIVKGAADVHCECPQPAQPADGNGADTRKALSYRMPSVCPCTKGTTVFLVGDHFSVHDTKVIAGHRCISDVTLLSRQVMRVTIPGDVATMKVDKHEYADVHIATPYGVTAHLHIPVVEGGELTDARKIAEEVVKEQTADLKNVVSTLRYATKPQKLDAHYTYCQSPQQLGLFPIGPESDLIKIQPVDERIRKLWNTSKAYDLAVAVKYKDHVSNAYELKQCAPAEVSAGELALKIADIAMNDSDLLPLFSTQTAEIKLDVFFYLRSCGNTAEPFVSLRTQDNLTVTATPLPDATKCLTAAGDCMPAATEEVLPGGTPAGLPLLEDSMIDPTEDPTAAPTLPSPEETRLIRPDAAPYEAAATGNSIRFRHAEGGATARQSSSRPLLEQPQRTGFVQQTGGQAPATTVHGRPAMTAQPMPATLRLERAPARHQPVGVRTAVPYNQGSYR